MTGCSCCAGLFFIKAHLVMICPGGCVGGPSKHQVESIVEQSRKNLLAQADDRKILDNLKNYPMDAFSMFRDGHME